MQQLEELRTAPPVTNQIPVSVIVPVRNEAHNLACCLDSLHEVSEVFVVDSKSGDGTGDIARSRGAQVVNFDYRGGWPKKRQWAMDTLALENDWLLLLDADESMTPELAEEIKTKIQLPEFSGYHIQLQMHFLGRRLQHGGANFYKLCFFRRGKGHFECRTQGQDQSMADMEVHEHVIVDGRTAKLKNSLLHRNVESLSRYILKHDEYSNWEARVWLSGDASTKELPPRLFGTQAQRRRWLRKKFFCIPGSPVLFFLYKYVARLGFLDGIPGLIYCGMQGIQFFHIKAKIYELNRG